MYWATAERPKCTPQYAAALCLTASRCRRLARSQQADATAIPQPTRINTSRQHPALKRHGTSNHANVQQLFVQATDLQVNFRLKADEGQWISREDHAAVDARQDKRASPRRRIGGLKSECSLIAARHCSKTRGVTQKEYLKDQRPNWHHSQLGELVRRIGTVPAMSAWKTAAGPPGPGQGSRLRRDRQSRLPGLYRVSAGPVFWFPRAYGFLRARRSTEHEAKYTGRSAFGWRPEAILVEWSRRECRELPFMPFY
jgi:hypothetical protein